MKLYILSYVIAACLFLGGDFIWLSVMGPTLYRPLLGDLILGTFKLAPALIFYLLYVVGIVVFAIRPAFLSGRWTTALLDGGLFGFLAYATYDLTNQATLKGWPVIVTVVDMCWGAVLTAASGAVGFLIVDALLKNKNY